MKESIAVKGEPVPNPMLGCGIILFLISVFDFCIYKLPSDLHLEPILKHKG